MHIVKLKGGLGNQMFQYAYGRNLELAGKKIIFDTSFFYGARAKSDTPRNFALNFFNLRTKAEFSPRKRPLRDFMIKIKRKLGFRVDEYFQEEKYFKNISDEIRQEFVLKNDLSPEAQNFLKQITKKPTISIHVRRGDYLVDAKTKLYHGTCDKDYYDKAIDLIKQRVSNTVFHVFSDDINWAKEVFSGDEFFFVSSPSVKDYEELILMSKCKHNIIANSSFSWWGAWLNENPEKIVIAPKQWFLNQKANKYHSLPENWLKI